MKPLIAIGIAFLSVLLGTGISAEVKDVDYSWARAVLPSGAEFNLEVADDPQSRWLGYRYREHVADDEGMLFIFEGEQRVSFEMRDCLVSLDMIFLDSKLQVVEIAHDRKPCVEGEPCSPISPMRNAQYVLELAAGTASREGLEPGDRVTVLSEPSIP
jgi:uncharacterized membrane protein (UPF0127 family)